MKTDKYIVNGCIFTTFEQVIEYNKINGYRVTATETINKNTFLISITKI